MANKPKHMESLIQIFKLAASGLSIKEISRRTNSSKNTIKKYLRLLNGRDYKSLSQQELSSLLHENDSAQVKSKRYQQLIEHFKSSANELDKSGVTKQLLWLEYKEAFPEGYNYSQYCHHFQFYRQSKDVVMHLEHKPGEEIMLDFAGHRPSYIDLETGEEVKCQLFVAVLPYSGLIFCMNVHSQKIHDFIRCINAMLLFFGGTSKIIICDNFRTAVTRTDRYDPVFTDLCYQLSDHYKNVFQAARPVKPRDKAMVEKSVNIVYNHIVGPLRNQVFHSLESLNDAYLKQLDVLNNKHYKGTSQSRLSIFTSEEKGLLIPLPTQEFNLKKSVLLTVQRNYHVQLSENHHYFSVPYTYVGKKVNVLYDDKTLEVYYNHQRIALHQRTLQSSAYHTQSEHMPSNHKHVNRVRGWTLNELLLEAEKIGPATYKAIDQVLRSSFFPEQNYKSSYGVLMLAKKFSNQRLEAACERALTGTRVNYTILKNILEKGLDKQKDLLTEQKTPEHENIRGSKHYQ